MVAKGGEHGVVSVVSPWGSSGASSQQYYVSHLYYNGNVSTSTLSKTTSTFVLQPDQPESISVLKETVLCTFLVISLVKKELMFAHKV